MNLNDIKKFNDTIDKLAAVLLTRIEQELAFGNRAKAHKELRDALFKVAQAIAGGA